MRIKIIKKVILTLLITSFFVLTSYAGPVEFEQLKSTMGKEDFDPLVDLKVTVEIQAIRSLEKFDYPNPFTLEVIDWLSDPDFFVKIFIEGEEFESEVWHDTKYIYEPDFSATLNVPDDQEFINIKIELWDWNSAINKLCDIGGANSINGVELTYSLKTGHWTGDDEISDPSGYGRLNGCDDGSVYKLQRDCELWFNIYQNDYDGDAIPYWTEVNVYGTDPEVDNTGEDLDDDDIPIEWEWKWDYDPTKKENHYYIDPDDDGIDNLEEFYVSDWRSDPYRQDIFIEFDYMETSPNGIVNELSEGTIELLNTVFNGRNIMIHIDDGCYGGSDELPFDESTTREEMEYFYWNYFLHGDWNNWRRGVFRYGAIVFHLGGGGYAYHRDAYVISSEYSEGKIGSGTQSKRDKVIASVYMHELGHTLNIRNNGVDNRNSYFPWQLGFWIYGPYKSCMNYRYVYRLVDYNDESSLGGEYNDWANLDVERFQRFW